MQDFGVKYNQDQDVSWGPKNIDISVQHILDLKRNIISLSELDSRGHKTFVKNECMKIL